MAKKFPKTKQGVRDLDAVYGKPRPGKKLDLPISQFCEHRNMHSDYLSGSSYCPDCKKSWDYLGNEY